MWAFHAILSCAAVTVLLNMLSIAYGQVQSVGVGGDRERLEARDNDEFNNVTVLTARWLTAGPIGQQQQRQQL